MTQERLSKEMLYQASLSPFKALLEDGTISAEDYRVIDTILRGQYSPLFIEKTIKNNWIIRSSDGNMSTPKGGLSRGKADL